jgi:hypothetical protein
VDRYAALWMRCYKSGNSKESEVTQVGPSQVEGQAQI